MEDERYTGVYVIGKRAVLEVGGTRSRLKDRESWYIIPDHHPAIIEKAVFDTVQASQLRFSQPNKKKRDYPLKGKASVAAAVMRCPAPCRKPRITIAAIPRRTKKAAATRCA